MFNFNIDDKKFFKIPLVKNSKIPKCSWSHKENWTTEQIDLNKFNYGILCGKCNNLIVIDLDLQKTTKDNHIIPSGIEKFNEFISQFGPVNTFTVQSPSGGIHYYFLYESKNKATNVLIQQLPNASEYFNSGIDIRTEKHNGNYGSSPGGYIVGPSSVINGNTYTIINNTDIIEMSDDLAYWLCQGIPGLNKISNNNIEKNIIEKNIKKKNNISNKIFFDTKYKYDTTIEYVETILNELPIEWVENRFNWLKVLTCLKNLNISGNEELFYKFSEKSTRKKHHTKIAKQLNKDEWNKNNCPIDFNYLICVVNNLKKKNYPLIQKYKPVQNNVQFDNVYSFNNKFVQYDFELFEKYDNIIIESNCGTGKTTCTVNNLFKYFEDYGYDKQIISIVSFVNTGNQHINSFSNGGIKLYDYRICGSNSYNNNLVICINSLLKLNFLSIEQIKDKIIYIDEFESLSDNLTHNRNLDNNIKLIYNLLMRLVKNCHKLIISDALINENVLNFLNLQNSNRKTIFIKNSYKKFDGIEAIRFHNENDFLHEIKNDIKNNNFFLFGSDSCSKITQYFDSTNPNAKDLKNIELDDKFITDIFHKLTDDIDPKDKDKFLLITSKTNIKITDANTQFANRFVFFSPSIVNSIDYSPDKPQNHYMYFNSMTINSPAMFQQSCRCRNINKLKFYANQRQHNFLYNDLSDVSTINKNLINSCERIKKVCLNIDSNDSETIVENIFFKMWCFNEYIGDCYNTNKICHFQNFLINAGFKLTHRGYDVKLDNSTTNKMRIFSDDIDIANYNFFIQQYKKFLIDPDIDMSLYSKYIERIGILNLKPDELDLNIFGYLVHDDFKFNSYLNILKLFKNEQFIDNKINELNDSSYSVKIFNNVYHKIKLLRQFEKKFNIQPFNFDFNIEPNCNFTTEEFTKYQKIFRSDKTILSKPNEFKIFYKQMIENIVGKNIPIINNIQINVERKKIRKYSINKQIINDFYLLSIRKSLNHNYDYNLLQIFDIHKPIDLNDYPFGIHS